MHDLSEGDPSELIADARRGVASAPDKLLALYRPYLKLLARVEFNQRLQSKLDASDLIQETSLLARRDFSQFAGSSEKELLGWLRQIMANVAAAAVRHYTRQCRDVRLERRLNHRLEQSSQRIEVAMCASTSTPSRAAQRRERSALLAEALEKMPADYRDVIVLRNLQSLSFDEVAERMNRTSGAVRMMWTRAIKRLRDQMDQPDAP